MHGKTSPLTLPPPCPLKHFARVAAGFGRDLHTAQHAGEFLQAFTPGQTLGRRNRAASRHRFGHGIGVVGNRRDLRQMRNAQHLVLVSQGLEPSSDDLGHAPADARVHLVKNQSRRGFRGGAEGFEGEHEAGELSAGCYLDERQEWLPRIGGQIKFDLIIAALCEPPAILGERRIRRTRAALFGRLRKSDAEVRALHAELAYLGLDAVLKLPGGRAPLLRQFVSPGPGCVRGVGDFLLQRG